MIEYTAVDRHARQAAPRVEQRFWTTQDVCDTLGLCRESIRLMVKDGRLPRPIKLSPGRAGRLRFNKADVLAAIARLNGEGSK